VDTVIVATSTPETTMPSVAARVAGRLGLSHPAAFDINAACAGFCHVLAVADAMVRGGVASGVLVIGTDKGSAWLDWNDRDTALLFGDGAGAVVVAPHEVPGIGPVLWGSLGESWDLVGIDPKSRMLYQNGRAVFRWAMSLGPLIEQLCSRTGVGPDDLSAFIPHQANLRIIRALAKTMPDHVLTSTDVVDTGNTIAATIPIALSRLLTQCGHTVRGGQALLFGFGAGLTYAGQIVTLP
jgi:3-oxoacyl-[acyl-carrier-protein] synthase-3